MAKISLATTWLDGCSGCHMSLLDMDEQLIEFADKVELLFGPLVDCKTFPDHVDITLVEGAVSSTRDRDNILMVRKRSKLLVTFGDCAITANVPAMRNRFQVDEVIHRSYHENADHFMQENVDDQPRSEKVVFQGIPRLLQMARPVHEFVPVDIFLPGCPPPPKAILYLFNEVMAGRIPDISNRTRFGA